jgi:hypothetical protein
MAGFIQDKFSPRDWVYGALTGVNTDILQPNGQWGLPIGELQREGNFDSYACVTFSILNCIEILELRMTGKERNYSDRFIAKKSGTVPGYGNSARVVADTIRQYGLLNEADYPWIGNESEYYKPLTVNQDWEAEKWLDDYSFNFDFLRPQWNDRQRTMMEALQKAPLAVAVKYANGSGVLNPIGGTNHFVTVYGYEEGVYWKVFDHYGNFYKKYDWNYGFSAILNPRLTIKDNNMVQLKEGQVYMLVEGSKQLVGLAVNDKLMVGGENQEALVLLNSAGRLGGMDKVEVIGVSLVDWNTITKTDLKGNKYVE